MININDKDELYEAYITNKMSSRDIAKHCDYSQVTILKRLKEFEIKERK